MDDQQVYNIMDDLGKGLGPALVSSWVRPLGRRSSFMLGMLGSTPSRGRVKMLCSNVMQLTVYASGGFTGPYLRACRGVKSGRRR